MNRKKISRFVLSLLIMFSTAFVSVNYISEPIVVIATGNITGVAPYNNNVPIFTDADKCRTDAFEVYSNLDALGRCGVAYANICKELMPTAPRGEIGMVKPSGWHTVKYDIVEGNYLYNRCHLIAYQLAGENANTKNLITGTRYLNTVLMLPYENMVADYVNRTGNHVLYRVTPVYQGNNLLASGVQLEGWSVEDAGQGICFNVCLLNIQPGIIIDYATGNSALDTSVATTQTQSPSLNKAGTENATVNSVQQTNNSATAYLSATGSKYHRINNCGRMNPARATQTTIADAQARGFDACSKCW